MGAKRSDGTTNLTIDECGCLLEKLDQDKSSSPMTQMFLDLEATNKKISQLNKEDVGRNECI